jgi:molybdopterin synthase sulfur carrier subunit
MRIKVKYFASLREKANKSEEEIETTAKTAEELFLSLNQKYEFEIESSQVKVAINEEYSSFEQPLSSADTVVFIPPVAGG